MNWLSNSLYYWNIETKSSPIYGYLGFYKDKEDLVGAFNKGTTILKGFQWHIQHHKEEWTDILDYIE